MAARSIDTVNCEASRFLERVEISVLDMKTEPSNGFSYIGHVEDLHTKFAVLFPLKDDSPKEMAQCLKKYFISYFGPPVSFASEGQQSILSEVLCEVLECWKGDALSFTLSESKKNESEKKVRKSEVVGNFVRDCISMMAAESSDNATWSDWLPEIMLRLNIARHTSVHLNPYSAVFGQKTSALLLAEQQDLRLDYDGDDLAVEDTPVAQEDQGKGESRCAVTPLQMQIEQKRNLREKLTDLHSGSLNIPSVTQAEDEANFVDNFEVKQETSDPFSTAISTSPSQNSQKISKKKIHEESSGIASASQTLKNKEVSNQKPGKKVPLTASGQHGQRTSERKMASKGVQGQVQKSSKRDSLDQIVSIKQELDDPAMVDAKSGRKVTHSPVCSNAVQDNSGEDYGVDVNQDCCDESEDLNNFSSTVSTLEQENSNEIFSPIRSIQTDDLDTRSSSRSAVVEEGQSLSYDPSYGQGSDSMDGEEPCIEIDYAEDGSNCEIDSGSQTNNTNTNTSAPAGSSQFYDMHELKRKLTIEDISFIENLKFDKPLITLSELRRRLLFERHVDVHISTISRAIKRKNAYRNFGETVKTDTAANKTTSISEGHKEKKVLPEVTYPPEQCEPDPSGFIEIDEFDEDEDDDKKTIRMRFFPEDELFLKGLLNVKPLLTVDEIRERLRKERGLIVTSYNLSKKIATMTSVSAKYVGKSTKKGKKKESVILPVSSDVTSELGILVNRNLQSKRRSYNLKSARQIYTVTSADYSSETEVVRNSPSGSSDQWSQDPGQYSDSDQRSHSKQFKRSVGSSHRVMSNDDSFDEDFPDVQFGNMPTRSSNLRVPQHTVSHSVKNTSRSSRKQTKRSFNDSIIIDLSESPSPEEDEHVPSKQLFLTGEGQRSRSRSKRQTFIEEESFPRNFRAMEASNTSDAVSDPDGNYWEVSDNEDGELQYDERGMSYSAGDADSFQYTDAPTGSFVSSSASLHEADETAMEGGDVGDDLDPQNSTGESWVNPDYITNKKLMSADLEFIQQMKQQNPNLTLREMKEILWKENRIDVHMSTISRALKKMNKNKLGMPKDMFDKVHYVMS